MAFEQAIPERVILLRPNPDYPHILDLELDRIQELQQYDSIEAHIVVYPYNRRISARDIVLSPYEEYAEDVLSENRSAYIRIHRTADKLFALLLGALVVAAHFWFGFDARDLFRAESLITVIGAVVIGKEIWDDLERVWINWTKTLRLRYIDSYYRFEIERESTLTRYTLLARRERMGRPSLPARFMDFMQQSNSQTVRLWFERDDLEQFPGDRGQILSIHIRPDLLEAFQKDGYLLGIKLSLNRGSHLRRRSLEFFQSLHRGRCGSLDDTGNWHDNTVYCRRTISLGRIKYFAEESLQPGGCLIGIDGNSDPSAEDAAGATQPPACACNAI